MWTFYDHLGQQLGAGATGADGQSAYQLWLDAGNTGSVEDFLLSLVGPIGPGVPNGGSAGEVLAKVSGSDQDTEWVNLDGRYAPITERQETTLALSIAPGEEVEVNLPLARIFGLLNVAATEPCRVRIYNSEADRTADAERTIYQAPSIEGGLVCDVLLTSDLLGVKLAPPQLGSFLDSAQPTRLIPALVRNNSASATLEVILTWWPIELFYQAPAAITELLIIGSPTVGSTLLTDSRWDGYPEPELAYQWQRSDDNSAWTNISGATASSYQLAGADIAKYVRVQITATNSRGTSTDSSASVGPVS